MTNAFDNRIVRVTIEYNNQKIVLEKLAIRARGQLFANTTSGQCEIEINNLTREQRHDILTAASPIKRENLSPINVRLEVGRESTGTFILFEGACFQGGITQPPDIGIKLYSLVNQPLLNLAVNNAASGISALKDVAASMAKTMNLTLFFKATDRQVENFNFAGTPSEQLSILNSLGGIIAYIDGATKELVVLDWPGSRSDEIREINIGNGMVGVPQSTAQGCSLRLMMDNTIRLTSRIRVNSLQNPSVNGEFIITSLGFEVASRDEPFWYDIQAVTPQLYLGTL